MRDKLAFLGLIAMLIFVLAPNVASAGRYERVMEKVVAIEQRLNGIESALQVSDIEQIRQELAALQAEAGSAGSDPALAGLAERMDDLATDMEKLRSQAKPTAPSGSVNAALQRQVFELAKSMQELKANSGMSWSDSDAKALDMRIAELAADLEELRIHMEEAPPSTISGEDFNRGFIADLRHLLGELRGTIGDTAASGGSLPGGITLAGFVDASYTYDINGGGNTFGFDQAEVDIEKDFAGTGALRFDLEWVNDGEGGFALDAEQGYLVFNPPSFGDLSWSFGKFNAPIGLELHDAPDMYQFSHALVFDYGLPTNLSGAMMSGSFEGGMDFSLYLCNAWDQNVDLNTSKTIGGRIGYTSSNDLICFGLSGIRGAQGTAEGDILSVVDVDMFVVASEQLILGGELNFGRDSFGGAADDGSDLTCTWNGFMVMGHYNVSNMWGITARYDNFDDPDALRLGSGIAETRSAFTIAPTFALGDGMKALFEFRSEQSNEEVFTDRDGEPTKSSQTVAFEMTYSF